MKELNPENINALWSEHLGVFDQIFQEGMQSCVNKLASEANFTPADGTLNCMDERTPGGRHLAGSGILLKSDETAAIADKLKIETIYWHRGCGAAKKYVEQHGYDPADADLYAEAYVEKVAGLLGIDYGERTLERPQLHIARIAYVSELPGGFDFRAGASDGRSILPPGFIIEPKNHPTQNTALEEVKIALDIAFGSHGFADRFTPESPFIICPVRPHNKQPYMPIGSISSVIKPYGNRVRIDGFTLQR